MCSSASVHSSLLPPPCVRARIRSRICVSACYVILGGPQLFPCTHTHTQKTCCGYGVGGGGRGRGGGESSYPPSPRSVFSIFGSSTFAVCPPSSLSLFPPLIELAQYGFLSLQGCCVSSGLVQPQPLPPPHPKHNTLLRSGVAQRLPGNNASLPPKSDFCFASRSSGNESK